LPPRNPAIGFWQKIYLILNKQSLRRERRLFVVCCFRETIFCPIPGKLGGWRLVPPTTPRELDVCSPTRSGGKAHPGGVARHGATPLGWGIRGRCGRGLQPPATNIAPRWGGRARETSPVGAWWLAACPTNNPEGGWTFIAQRDQGERPTPAGWYGMVPPRWGGGCGAALRPGVATPGYQYCTPLGWPGQGNQPRWGLGACGLSHQQPRGGWTFIAQRDQGERPTPAGWYGMVPPRWGGGYGGVAAGGCNPRLPILHPAGVAGPGKPAQLGLGGLRLVPPTTPRGLDVCSPTGSGGKAHPGGVVRHGATPLGWGIRGRCGGGLQPPATNIAPRWGGRARETSPVGAWGLAACPTNNPEGVGRL
jgi:hypothetical protein